MNSIHSKYIGWALAAVLIAFIVYLIHNQIEEYQLQHDPKLHELKGIFHEFFEHKGKKGKKWEHPLTKLNDTNPMKRIKLLKGGKSYTINKEKVYLCLKDEKEQYYNLNMLIYVTAHELAHVLCDSIGHTDEFHAIFEALLVELTDQGIYDPKQEILLDYCAHGVDDNDE